MRRRLDLAASLIGHPAVLFLDEPTTGLDPNARAMTWDIVRQLVADGTTLLLTTQYLEEADQLASRVAVIDGGQVIAEGTPDRAQGVRRRRSGWTDHAGRRVRRRRRRRGRSSRTPPAGRARRRQRRLTVAPVIASDGLATEVVRVAGRGRRPGQRRDRCARLARRRVPDPDRPRGRRQRRRRAADRKERSAA